METCLAQNCAAALNGASSGVIFTHLIKTLLTAQCALNSDDLYPPDRTSEILSENPTFDFIIIGGGSAGSVLASRLSEIEKWKILLVEEGKNPSFNSRIPGLMFSLWSTDENDAHETELNENYCLGTKGKRCVWTRGRALGGSSVINAMLYLRGNKKDYDQWSEMGNEGWSFEEVLPYFRKSESYNPEFAARVGKKYFGTDGPLRIRKYNYSSTSLSEIVMEAVKEVGIPILETFNGKDQIGYGNSDSTVDNGMRHNVAEAYLSIAKDRKNLYVLRSTKAEKIIMSRKKATGVRLKLEDGRIFEARASKEVIVSAGSIGTPQLLMLSGIGPRDHLEEFGIENLVDLPVGKHLEDHIVSWGVLMTFDNKTAEPVNPTYLLDEAYKYLIYKTGVFSTIGGSHFMGFVNVNDQSAKYPDIQYHHLHISKGNFLLLESIIKRVDMTDELAAEMNKILSVEDIFFVLPTLLNPKSSGEIRLRSADPRDKMKIITNQLSHPHDMDTMKKSVGFLRELLKTKALNNLGMKLHHLDISGCRHTKPDSDKYWECNFRHTGSTVYHPVGTAKMGPHGDPEAVVDPRLKVHGVTNLRVIDASIMPKIPSGNTNSPTVMVAERGADFIKEYWLAKDEL